MKTTSAKAKLKTENDDYPTFLTKTRVEQFYDYDGVRTLRYVLLKDLKKYMSTVLGTSSSSNYRGELPCTPEHNAAYPKILFRRRDGKMMPSRTWLDVYSDGRIGIGCQTFTLTSSKKILKAAGIKLKKA